MNDKIMPVLLVLGVSLIIIFSIFDEIEHKKTTNLLREKISKLPSISKDEIDFAFNALQDTRNVIVKRNVLW